MDDLSKLNDEQLLELDQELQLKNGLPHLFGFKRYKWQHDFEHSTARDNFLCAANQIGKSTIQICKAIRWATEPELWSKLWETRPTQFWYFYPSLKLATAEYKEKWKKQILPRNGFEKDDRYGWTEDMRQKTIQSITFNTGITIYFCSYAQNEMDLQAATVYAMFCDEELPYFLWPELQARLRDTRGYYHQVFTATIGQEIWRATIEEKGKFEKFPNAFKRQVSLYDCKKYMDGTPAKWTDERIQEEIQRCGTQIEIDRRIMGKFVVEGGLMYPTFSREDHIVEGHMLPHDWLVFSAVDVGSGGEKGHPAAIVFIAVNPEFTKGRVFKCWRGDGIQTTAGDILMKYMEMKGELNVVDQVYDWSSADFKTVSKRLNMIFNPANKTHSVGQGIVNTLFKNNMLKVYDSEEARKLAAEITSLKIETDKKNAADDLCDALRYCCTAIPWDFSTIKGVKSKNDPLNLNVPDDRERFRLKQKHTKLTSDEIEKQEIEEQMQMFFTDEWEDFNESCEY